VELAKGVHRAAGSRLAAAVFHADPSAMVGGNIVVGDPPASFCPVPRGDVEEHGIGASSSVPPGARRTTQKPGQPNRLSRVRPWLPRHHGAQRCGGVHHR
jgi:hypothetical protein